MRVRVHGAVVPLFVSLLATAACEDETPLPGGDMGGSTTGAAGTPDASLPGSNGGTTGEPPAATTGATGSDDSMMDPEMMPASAEPADYANPANWLCRPENNAACDVDLSTTVVAADGTMTAEPFEPHADPPIDCFYVYPTVSLDETPNSDLIPGPEEESVVRAQFARMASQCRLFAPMYRQITLTALRSGLASGGGLGSLPADPALGFRDVLAAWQHYLEHDNQGRGVVLVGHSQGSSMLTQLIKMELDTAPVDPRFLGGLLLGTNVLVPMDGVVGGSFQNVPLCQSAEELGCVVAYASFRAEAPPPTDALFGSSMEPGLVAGCTNPAALGGGSGELHAYLTKDGPGASSNPMGPWVEGGAAVETPFVSVPGLLSAECVFGHTGYYLAITTHGVPEDPRTDRIEGDVVTLGMVQAGWGLHLLDAHAAMGNLVDIVRAKAEAAAAASL